MKIRFTKIHIENFLSIGEAEVSLEDRGYTLIRGINHNPLDNASSNGAGKSTIFEAISWALTGQTIRGISSNISNIYSEGGCKVELSFILNSKDEYRVIRSRDHKELGSTLQLYINGKNESGKGLRDTEKILEEFLPELNNNLIGSVIILGQGLPQRFTNNTPSGRKEVLEKLSKSDFMIEDIKSKIYNRQLKLESQLREVEDTQLSLKSRVDTLKEMLIKTEAHLNSLPDEKDIEEIISQLQIELNSIFKIIEDKESIKKYLVDELQKVESKKNTILLENSKETSNAEIEKNNLYHEAINQKNVLKFSIDQLTQEINKLKSITDICPTCGQKIPGISKPDTSTQELKLEEYNKSLRKCESHISKINEDWEIKSALIKDKYINLNKENLDKEKELRDKIEALEEDILVNNNLKRLKEQDVAKYQQQKESLQNDKARVLENIESYKKEIEDLNNKALYNDSEKVEIQSRLDIISKIYTIAKRDFRGYLLSNIISFINDKAKEYCNIIFGTNNILFELDKNNINISYCGKLYENLSGGEKQKIDIIIQFSIRDMLCQLSNFSSNILVLDEVFDNIDSLGCEKIVDLISRNLTDIESVFIITHHSDIPIGADSVITIIKNEKGISSLQ